MIGTLDPRDKRVTVIGGGIAGLLAAYRLDRAGYEVTLHEGSDRLGGLVRTQTSEWGIAESGPHSLLVSEPVRALFDELGVALSPVQERARYIWRGGKPHRFPLRLWEAAFALARAYFALAPRRGDPGELTFQQWGLRHLGRAATEYLLTPFVLGIYGARPSELQTGMAFPGMVVPRGHSLLSSRLARARARRRATESPGVPAPVKARSRMMAPAHGMGALTSALEAALRAKLGARLRVGSPVTELPREGNVVLCVPAPEAARLLTPRQPELARALTEVRYAPLVSVTAFVRTDALARPPRGVGVLMPPAEGRECLGILFNSSAFAGRAADGVQSFTLIFGGTLRPAWLDATDEALRAAVQGELAACFGLGGAPEHIVAHRWPRAVPLYDGALARMMAEARRTWCSEPGRVLFGNYAGQVSIRGMIESVARWG